MSVKDLINAISMGNAAETQEVFQAVMAEKISARLDDMRIEVAKNMFKEEACKTKLKEEESDDEAQIEEDLNLEDYSVEELEEFMQSEEYEQLDELSKKTLGNYIKKAAKHATRLEVGFERASRGLKAHYPFGDLEKAGKREAGIAKAVDRLTK